MIVEFRSSYTIIPTRKAVDNSIGSYDSAEIGDSNSLTTPILCDPVEDLLTVSSHLNNSRIDDSYVEGSGNIFKYLALIIVVTTKRTTF